MTGKDRVCVPRPHTTSLVVRRSPRMRSLNRRTPIDAYCCLSDEPWNVFSVMRMNGCTAECAVQVHDVSEFEILQLHATFSTKSSQQQRQWLLDYFASNCPLNAAGEKEPGKITWFICGKEVCQSLWLATLSVSQSRFYEIRKNFLGGQLQVQTRQFRSMSSKSQLAIAWMESYFDRIGDKRPDKERIYLPSCLTEKSIYSYMIEQLHKGNENEAVCFSQFNRLYREYFANVNPG